MNTFSLFFKKTTCRLGQSPFDHYSHILGPSPEVAAVITLVCVLPFQ